ncbi:ATP synthase gamma chain [Trichinella spiralis]|uniref:ATP synthase gamma chain n=1 Tax=Trichinella spiralis TaxID=6334 RepID=A0ABR3L0F2_TRISP
MYDCVLNSNSSLVAILANFHHCFRQTETTPEKSKQASFGEIITLRDVNCRLETIWLITMRKAAKITLARLAHCSGMIDGFPLNMQQRADGKLQADRTEQFKKQFLVELNIFQNSTLSR